jgi:hypothetical protein
MSGGPAGCVPRRAAVNHSVPIRGYGNGAAWRRIGFNPGGGKGCELSRLPNPIAPTPFRALPHWQPDGPGFARVTVLDGRDGRCRWWSGRSDMK